MTSRLFVWAFATAALVWFALVVLAPVLPPLVGAVVYAAGSLVCHQRPERSFHWAGAQLAVCARCTGIYLGGCAAVLAVPLPPALRRPRTNGLDARVLLTAAALPTAITVALEWIGWWAPSSLVRALTGIPLGIAVSFVVVAAATATRGRR